MDSVPTKDDREEMGRALARLLAGWYRQERDAAGEPEGDSAAPPPEPPRKRRPSRLAKWEAQWRADGEAES